MAGTAENLQAKINYSLELVKLVLAYYNYNVFTEHKNHSINRKTTKILNFFNRTPWLDRETMIKRIERLQKEILILQQKLEELSKKEIEECKEQEKLSNGANNDQVIRFILNLIKCICYGKLR